MNYTYILECADGSYYCGWTNDLEKRLQTHNAGKGGKYTRTRLPVRLAYYEEYETKEEAMSREWHIKQLSRDQKKKLISTKPIPIESFDKEIHPAVGESENKHFQTHPRGGSI
nr:GIY-YIG nuclease family protein [uncultured Butyrivibrio sp.]